MNVAWTPREMIYQCSFTKDVKLKKLPCNPNTKECWDICKTTPDGTIFWDEEYMTSNALIAAFQPKACVDDAHTESDNESYCVNLLKAGSMSTSGGTFVGWPCMSFSVKFWLCDKNYSIIGFDSIIDDKKDEWAPNTNVKVQVIN